MARRNRILAQQLPALEDEFRSLLLACLEHGARGRWGLFGHNEELPEGQKLLESWPEVARLRDLASHIQSAHQQTGTHNSLCDHYLNLCAAPRTANTPGEPKLAKAFLQAFPTL